MRAQKYIINTFIFFIAFTPSLMAQDDFDKALENKINGLNNEKTIFSAGTSAFMPNSNLQSVTTPTGWGGGGSGYFYVVIGGIFPALYADPHKVDLITAAGFSYGDPVKYVSISTSVNITRVSELRDLSANIILSKQIFRASSISIGGLQLFANKKVSDAPGSTFYIAFSHSVQGVRSDEEGYSALGYTIGFGNGRFLLKSPKDIQAGKGRYGTGVFANVSYEIEPRLNVNAEWSGLNLGFSLGIRPLQNSSITVGFGVYNLTKYSGDRKTYMALVGIPVFLKNNKKKE